MLIPTLTGIIDRRLLVNFNADPGIIQNILPAPFRPKLYRDRAIVGVCLIRLRQIRPKGFPRVLGISSENGAHRFAVEWTENGHQSEGVFIPRRDTSSILNMVAGGRIFPGLHHLSKFKVAEFNGRYQVSFANSDGTSFSVDGTKTERLPPDSLFNDVSEVSAFFENGSIGYTPNKNGFDGLQLRTFNWKVEPLKVMSLHSTLFHDKTIFPEGSIHFDNALLMTKISHEWQTLGQMCHSQ
jgi:hypothetical protein